MDNITNTQPQKLPEKTWNHPHTTKSSKKQPRHHKTLKYHTWTTIQLYHHTPPNTPKTNTKISKSTKRNASRSSKMSTIHPQLYPPCKLTTISTNTNTKYNFIQTWKTPHYLEHCTIRHITTRPTNHHQTQKTTSIIALQEQNLQPQNQPNI